MAAKSYGFIVFYIFSNAALYFLDKNLFRLAYFYGGIVLFDTLCLVLIPILSRQIGADFYVALFLTDHDSLLYRA